MFHPPSFLKESSFRLRYMLIFGFLVFGVTLSAQSKIHKTVKSQKLSSVDNQAIPLDGKDKGRIFDGIGALSAGASSRLLIDYPEPQRAEILDYLFKPNFGAALQINKVEIGGDMNSTDGSEPSHMRTPDDHNYQRGYEWWLMEESKKRNPAVKLYALAWGTPGWVNPVCNNPWTKEYNTYLLDWVHGAKIHHNLTIDYLGGWNENEQNSAWFIQLRQVLDKVGLKKLQVVASDNFLWEIGSVMAANPSYTNSFQIIGMHYPESREKMAADPVMKKNWEAYLASGKPLWGSEVGSAHYNGGAADLARLYNRGYIDHKITTFINWSTIWSVLPGLPFTGCGLMLADQPWSGSYDVGLSIWVTAHTTQFAQPGWQYLDQACGYFAPEDPKAGSHVALRSPDGRNFSVIVETVDAQNPAKATFQINRKLNQTPLHVWKSVMNKNKPGDWFLRQADVMPDNKGRFTMTFDPNCLYSVTSTDGQSKGMTTSPPRSPLQLPYKESFQNTPIGKTPKYFSDMHGTFEIAPAKAGGQCLRQVVTMKPVCWTSDADPATLIGDLTWSNYTVKSEVLLEQPGYVELLGRVSGGEQNSVPGYHLRISDTGHWSLFYRANRDYKTRKEIAPDAGIASGEMKEAAGTGKWHKLSLGFQGDKISASIDGQDVVKELIDRHTDEAVARKVTPCFTGYATSRWVNGQFRNFEVLPNPQK